MSRVMIFVLTALASAALLLAACGGGDEGGADGGGGSPETYRDDLRAIVVRTSDRLDEVTAPLDEAESLAEFLDALLDVTDDVLTVQREALADVNDLTPPDDLQADHDRFLRGMEAILDKQSGIKDALDDEDLDKFQEISGELEAEEAALEADLSPEYRALIEGVFGEDASNGGLTDGAEDADSGNRSSGSATAAPPGQLAPDFPPSLVYPAATVVSSLEGESDGERTLFANFETKDSAADVADFYEDRFNDLGFHNVETAALGSLASVSSDEATMVAQEDVGTGGTTLINVLVLAQ